MATYVIETRAASHEKVPNVLSRYHDTNFLGFFSVSYVM